MPFYPSTAGIPGPVQLNYDVTLFGATGNGITDDTAAIQAAIDDSKAHATNTHFFGVYFPQGTYLVSSSLTWEGTGRFWGDGPNTTLITANFNGYVFDETDTPNSANPGPDVFENLGINNLNGTANTAGCIRVVDQKVGITVNNCLIKAAGIGVTHGGLANIGGGGIFDIRFYGNKFVSLGATSIGVRINSGGTYVDVGNEFQGHLVGRQLCGQGFLISGGRQEDNGTANLFGVAPNGDALTMSNLTFVGQQFEANGITLDLRWVTNSTFADISGALGEDPPQRDSTYGFLLGTVDNCTFDACAIDAIFSKAAIQIGPSVNGCTFTQCTASSTTATAADWSVSCYPDAVTFINCDYNPPGSTGNKNVLGNAVTGRGIGRTDYLNGTVTPKNLSGSVAVGTVATSVNVVFAAAELTGLNFISSLTPSNGGSLTASGSYHYKLALVTETGEACGDTPLAITLTGGDRTVTVATSSTSYTTPYRKRLYRGVGTSLSAVYDGYWDLAPGNTVSFVDTGAVAFSGIKQPGRNGDTPAAAEADALYNVVVSPGWDTTWWITGRSTTGFTIHFSAAPGSDVSVGWMLYR